MQSDSVTVGPGGTVTFLFTDIEGSTQLLQQVGAAYPAVLEQHTALLHAVFERCGGRVVDRAGDGLFVVFNRARNALAATVDAQRALLTHAWPEGASVRVRMGVHTGEPVVSGSGYVGLDVHRAARVSAAAHGGQILISEATRQLVAGQLPDGIGLLDLGEHRLKDLPREERLHQVVAQDLPSAFPPPRTASVLAGNLPARPLPLIGRDSELTAIHDLLRREDVRLLTLTGAGGTGKTSLAVELAARSIDDFRDGIAYVPLAAISEPTFVFTAIAQTLGVSPAAAQPVRDAVMEHLRTRQMLLVLDNFEHVLGAAADIAVLAHRAPGVTLLVTSRFALNLTMEREFPVAPLRTPDPRVSASASTLRVYPAVELFVQRATAVKPGFGLDDDSTVAVAAICHRLDGLPLAIELAAARIKIFSPRALLARLDRRLELLSGGARDMPARHRTLRHTIGWSYDLLAPDEQALFRRLAVFAGGCSLEAAEVVCAAAGEPVVPALDGVSALVDKSLLRQDSDEEGEPRFIMLETVRDFALERLEASGEDALTRAAHADLFISLSETAAPELAGAGQPIWLDRLERDHDNLRAAFDWAIRTGDAARALRLGAALGRFWIIRAIHTEGRQRLRSALALPGSPDDQPMRARILTGAAVLAYEQLDLEEANALLQEALAYHRLTGDGRCIGETLNHLGWVAFLGGSVDRATLLSQEALTAHEERKDARGIALSLTNLGGIAMLRGDFEPALTLYERALELRRGLKEARSIAYGMINLSWTLHLLGHHDRATTLAEDGLHTLRSLGDKQLGAFACWTMGEAALDQGNLAEAVRLLEEGADFSREIVQRSTLALAQAFMAEALALRGEMPRALQFAREAVSIHERDSIFLWRVFSLMSEANVQRMAGAAAESWDSYLRALNHAHPRRMRYCISRCAAGLASLAADAARYEIAVRLAGAARTLRASTGAPMVAGREPDLDRIAAAARDAIGVEAATRAYEEGAARAFDDLRQLLTGLPARPVLPE